MNKNELIIDRVRRVTASDPATGELLYTITSIEEPSLQCSAEGEEVVDALGSPITTLYRAKKAKFSGTNSLFNFGLYAAQLGTKKEIADESNKITVPTCEICTIADGAIKLKHTPKNDIKYIYGLVDGEIATKYEASASADATHFLVGESGAITTPTGVTGKVFVEYDYESTNAMKIRNKATEFPEACTLKIYAYLRDKCNENVVYSGVVIGSKAKISAEQLDVALTSTGKHGFEYNLNKDYCDDEGELFSVIIAE